MVPADRLETPAWTPQLCVLMYRVDRHTTRKVANVLIVSMHITLALLNFSRALN